MKARFGLRSFLIGVSAVGVLFGAGMIWYHAQEAEFLRQQEVVERVKACGADVTWEKHVPLWLSWVGNSSAFKRVAAITGGKLDCILNELPNLPDVKEITTSNDQLSRDELDRLAQLEQISKITIANSLRMAGEREEDVSPDEIDARLPQKTIIKLP